MLYITTISEYNYINTTTAHLTEEEEEEGDFNGVSENRSIVKRNLFVIVGPLTITTPAPPSPPPKQTFPPLFFIPPPLPRRGCGGSGGGVIVRCVKQWLKPLMIPEVMVLKTCTIYKENAGGDICLSVCLSVYLHLPI